MLRKDGIIPTIPDNSELVESIIDPELTMSTKIIHNILSTFKINAEQ